MKLEKASLVGDSIRNLTLPINVPEGVGRKNVLIVSQGRLKRSLNSSTFDNVPYSPPVLSIGTYAASVNEGGSITFTLYASNVAPNASFTWDILGASGASSADFNHPLSGVASLANGRVQVTVSPIADYKTEGSEEFTFRFKLDGAVVAETQSININDTSQTPSGAQQFSVGTHSIVVPQGVTSMYGVAIGGGSGGGGKVEKGSSGRGGGGGALAHRTFGVVPGETLTIVVGPGGAGGTTAFNGEDGGVSYVERTSNSAALLRANGGNGYLGGSPSIGSGGKGGDGATVGWTSAGRGGGGAGGYSGDGGDGGDGYDRSGSNGSGGAGGGGAGADTFGSGRGGGGVGLNGPGESGSSGQGGSGGYDGNYAGGRYGGGGGGRGGGNYDDGIGGSGGNGGVKLFWGTATP